MSKVKPDETTTALATAPAAGGSLSLLPTKDEMNDGFKAPSVGQFLPFMEMVFPIMITPKFPEYKGHEYKIGFKEGGKFLPLPAGTIVSVIDKRNSVRVKNKKEDGSVENEYGYAAIDRKGHKFERSAAFYNEMSAKAKTADNIDDGYSMVVLIFMPDGRTALADFAAYKTMTSYLYPALSAANLLDKIGLRIDIEDHTPNLKESKNGFFYPDSKKFKQWEHVQLSAEQLTKGIETLKLNEEAYQNWFTR